MKTDASRLTPRLWSSIILFGLFGQIAWVIENMYFNVFMDRTVGVYPVALYLMVAFSAVTATAATLVGGTLSDIKGKRKVFISWGYVIWGVTVMLFAFISVKNTQTVFPSASANTAIMVTVAAIIFMDCVMSFFGSVSNDAGFNAWVTDNTTPSNRGKGEGVLAIMPLLALVIIFGLFDGMTADTYLYTDGTTGAAYKLGETVERLSVGNWTTFFIVLGAMTSFVGILGLFLLKDSPKLTPSKTASFYDIFYGFRKSVIKDNKILYMVYLSVAIVGVANNAYMPYLIIYAQRTLGLDNYIIPVGIIIIASAVASVLFGMKADKYDRRHFMPHCLIMYVVGSIMMLLSSPILFGATTPMIAVCISGFILMTGNLAISALFTALIRDLTPPDKIGLFQGVRMFFFVLLPMCIGPLPTAIITQNSQAVGADYYGHEIYNYPPTMFLISAIVVLPLIYMIYKMKQAPAEAMHYGNGEEATDKATCETAPTQAPAEAMHYGNGEEATDKATCETAPTQAPNVLCDKGEGETSEITE